MAYDIIPVMLVNPKGFTFYAEQPSRGSNGFRSIETQAKNVNLISYASIKKLREKIAWFCYLSKTTKFFNLDLQKYCTMKIAMITLTLSAPQMHSDSFIKNKMLNTFLTIMRQKGIRNYVWRAETQANGRLHFHIIINRYWYWKDIRRVWNQIQNNYGYLDYYKKNYNNDDPNSVDIHSMKRIRNIESYLSKYLSKSMIDDDGINYSDHWQTLVYSKSLYDIATKRRIVKGKVFSCSAFLSALKSLKIQLKLNPLLKTVIRKIPNCKEYNYDFCDKIFSSVEDWRNLIPDLYFKFRRYIIDTSKSDYALKMF